jgi:hypothetical protein
LLCPNRSAATGTASKSGISYATGTAAAAALTAAVASNGKDPALYAIVNESAAAYEAAATAAVLASAVLALVITVPVLLLFTESLLLKLLL